MQIRHTGRSEVSGLDFSIHWILHFTSFAQNDASNQCFKLFSNSLPHNHSKYFSITEMFQS